MDMMMTYATYTFLLFFCMIRGTYGRLMRYNESADAVVGQNISLQCIVGEEHAISVIQLEWTKQEKGNEKNDQKIVVFHPTMEEVYYSPGYVLETVVNSKTGNLQGSILKVYGVTKNSSGNYICEITSFPNGSIKRTTKLKVAEAPASVKIHKSHSYRFIKEGDEVKITCSASPPPLRYKLGRSKDELFSMKNTNGEFILPNVTRNNSDLYICSPEWDSLGRLNATVELTVNFLDGIECNTSSPLNISAGEDVAISCIAKASQSLLYKWMRGDTTLSSSDVLSLTSVTSDQSGTYKLTAVSQDGKLQTDMQFSLYVFSTQRKETTTAFPLRTTKHLTNFTSFWSNSWSTGAVEKTTTESDHFLTSTSKPNATMTNPLAKNTSRHTPLTDSSSAPPVGNASTLHASTAQSTDSHADNTNTTRDPATRRKVVISGTTQNNITNPVTTAKDSKSKGYIVVPIVLLLLVLIGLLYRRYLYQKKMDMPPPFKPPPPPVKYTSARKHDVPMTDILI